MHPLSDKLDNFTDRERILDLFKQYLRSAQLGQLHLLAVTGISGIGKTFLIEYLSRRICPEYRWKSGQLSFVQSAPDFRFILEGLEDALKSCVPREKLKQYRSKRDEYYRRFDEYRASSEVKLSVEAIDYSSVSNITQNVQINTQIHVRERQLRAELSRAILELAEENEQSLCLFIDGYERLTETDTELEGWMWESILLKLARTASHPLLIVTSGWNGPGNAAIAPFSQTTTLEEFDLERVRNYLQNQEVIPLDYSPPNHQELVVAFYELTKGHPLVLDLAVTYFKQLNSGERTAQSMRTKRPLVDEQARVEFLDERLLKRLPEPHRTLLERGPILRTFDQAALRAILRVELEGAPDVGPLDDQSYRYFLRYPFIHPISATEDSHLALNIFHELVRRVGLGTLRRHHPETKEQLHRAMTDYYKRIVGDGRSEQEGQSADTDGASKIEYSEWFTEIPEIEFNAQLEYLYHALQVRELQADAFEEWDETIGRAVNRWRRRQARFLLDLVQQLVEEDEHFLRKTTEPYGQYLIWYAKFLMQEGRWQEALNALSEAKQLFEEAGNVARIAVTLNNIGQIYSSQGKLEQALEYCKKALDLYEQIGETTDIAVSLENLGVIYYSQGGLEQALNNFMQAASLFKQLGNGNNLAGCIHNIGSIYQAWGDFQQSLNYYEIALKLFEQANYPIGMALSLNGIGTVYSNLEEWNQALEYYEQSLKLRERIGNPVDIARSLNNIGDLFRMQGKLDDALSYHERALVIREKMGNPTDLALSLNHIGGIYFLKKKWEGALDYFERALALREQVGNPIHIANSLDNIGGIYDSQENWEEAMKYYRRALDLREQVGVPGEIARSLNEIGKVYNSRGLWKEALKYFNKALAVVEQAGISSDIAKYLNNIGVIYDTQGKSEQAVKNFMKALEFAEQVNDIGSIKQSLYNLGNVHQKQGNLEHALIYFKRILVLAREVASSIDIAQSLTSIAKIYQMQGKPRQAINEYGEALTIYESLGHSYEAKVAEVLIWLADCYSTLGEFEKSAKYQAQAQQIYRTLF